MSATSPTLEGFRAAFRRPSLTFAEIAWRWTVGAVALTLFIFSFIEYLDTLPISESDVALLGTRQPLLVGKAISHILRGSLNRVMLTVLLAALALAVLWIIAASLGRAAIVRALLDYFRRNFAGDTSTEPSDSIRLPVFRALITLNFLRVAVTLGSILAFAGAAILSSLAFPDRNPQPAVAFVLFLPFATLICVVWSTLNWLLSLASIFTIRDGDGAQTAISAAVEFSRDHAAPVFAVSTWTGLAHLVAISVAATAISLPLAFIQLLPGRFLIAAFILVLFAYLAIVDWLYIARLAGYVCIMELPEIVATPATQSIPPDTRIDRDEPILSDLPNLAVET